MTALANVVSIGGGTGLACLLKGVKHGVLDPPVLEAPAQKPWIARLTAVVTVTDDGGSSGRLRKELRVLPPGDVRNCLVALSTDESLLSHLFQYRFEGSGDLAGHSFGNLFLTALTAVTGDFLKAIQVTSDVLSIRGKIFPSTLSDVRLDALMDDGTHVVGETTITRHKQRIRRISLRPQNCQAVPGALDAIRNADLITIGPGSLYTSLIPNLLVRGIVKAIRESKAIKIFIGNLMTQPGETTGLTASDHLAAISEHAGMQLFDGIILNNQPISSPVLARYKRRGSSPVINDYERLRDLGLKIYEDRILSQEKVVRHDPHLLARSVHEAYTLWRAQREFPEEVTFSLSL
jgi:uncharacterized cofD-like protein